MTALQFLKNQHENAALAIALNTIVAVGGNDAAAKIRLNFDHQRYLGGLFRQYATISPLDMDMTTVLEKAGSVAQYLISIHAFELLLGMS